MDQTERAAYVITQAIAALVEALGMISENMDRMSRGETMAYREEDFDCLFHKYLIGHNSVIGQLRQ